MSTVSIIHMAWHKVYQFYNNNNDNIWRGLFFVDTITKILLMLISRDYRYSIAIIESVYKYVM